MNTETNRIDELIIKFNLHKQGKGDDLSAEEKEELQQWKVKDINNQNLFSRLTDLDYLKKISSINVKVEKRKIMARYFWFKFKSLFKRKRYGAR